MCSIFGWVPLGQHQRRSQKAVAEKLVQQMRHRGPDDCGYVQFDLQGRLFCERDKEPEGTLLMLGQNRLSIIDLSHAGHQPMTTPDGRYTIVFNGEIYNYIELREQLRSKGVEFRTNTDTEVLLYWLVHYGDSRLTSLVGMFAFAFYDADKRTLLCVRDYFGIKPFFYSVGSGGFCFASELPSILSFPHLTRRLCAQAAYDYLSFGRYDGGRQTFLRDVCRLLPGCCVKVNLDKPDAVEETYFWKPDLEKRSDLSFDEAAKHIRELFLKNIQLHLRSDVPLGIALSGGIDSSSIACGIRQVAPKVEMHAFSFIANDARLSEEKWVDLVTQEANLITHKVKVGHEELFGDLDDMIANQGEPFGSTSIYAQYRVFKLARENGITVTLDGQGADEIFAGYSGYQGARIATMVCKGRVFEALRYCGASSHNSELSYKRGLLMLIKELTPKSLQSLRLRLLGGMPRLDVFRAGVLKRNGVEAMSCGFDDRETLFPKTNDIMRKTLAYQLTHFGLQHLLRHADRNSMAFSIESRVPYLTHELSEFVLSLPENYLVSESGESKHIMRKALRGITPDIILDRRDKIGFETPEGDWFLADADKIDEIFKSANGVPLINPLEMSKEWHEIVEGRLPYNRKLWRWVNYIKWATSLGIVE